MTRHDRSAEIDSPVAVARPDALRWRRWTEELVVFDRRSGDTHLLSGPSGQIFEILLREPQPASRLPAAVCGAGGDANAEASTEEVLQALSELRRLGLIA